MTAAVDVSKAGISKTFTTRNTLTSNQSILMIWWMARSKS
jgi:ribosome-associated toxin RatA of RatAB toxin-antitoxin module